MLKKYFKREKKSKSLEVKLESGREVDKFFREGIPQTLRSRELVEEILETKTPYEEGSLYFTNDLGIYSLKDKTLGIRDHFTFKLLYIKHLLKSESIFDNIPGLTDYPYDRVGDYPGILEATQFNGKEGMDKFSCKEMIDLTKLRYFIPDRSGREINIFEQESIKQDIRIDKKYITLVLNNKVLPKLNEDERKLAFRAFGRRSNLEKFVKYCEKKKRYPSLDVLSPYYLNELSQESGYSGYYFRLGTAVFAISRYREEEDFNFSLTVFPSEIRGRYVRVKE